MNRRPPLITAASDVGLIRQNNEDSHMVNRDRMCFAVADGVGGAPHGEIASAIATQAAYQVSKRSGLTARQVVEQSFQLAAEKLADKDGTKYSGAMTTLVVLCLDGHDAVYGHVGDSRLYMRRRGNDVLLTTDHQHNGYVTQVLGTRMSMAPTMGHIRAFDNDTFILCTDGVSNELTKAKIVATGHRFTASTIVNHAVAAGGRDNATAIVVKIRAPRTP